MTFCANFNKFTKYIQQYNQDDELKADKEKPLRYNVWATTHEEIKKLFSDGIDTLPWENEDNNSQHVKTKVENALRRMEESGRPVTSFMKDIINDDDHNIEHAIALHELMETVKGEADKARNLGFEVSALVDKGELPAVPLSRLAASIGRKIAYQKGIRFHSDEENKKTAAEIETLYYGVGKIALDDLQEKGYVDLHTNLQTIKDYIDVSELTKTYPSVDVLTKKGQSVLSVTLNEKKLGISPDNGTANYFLNRTEADLDGTDLGVITDALGAIKQITQPATLELPDTSATRTLEQLVERDDQNIGIDPETEKTRKAIYDNPVFVHKTVHSLMQKLNAKALDEGISGSKIIMNKFRGKDSLLASLFGLKNSENFSIDKKESVSGQNLSKTTPLNDLVEHYGILQGENSDPVGLHLAMKIGRNARLYYENSVLNPHGSKQDRYMLTSGEYTVDTNSADFDYLVYGIKEALGTEATYEQLIGDVADTKINNALKFLTTYEATGRTLNQQLTDISNISKIFPGVDYVTLLTTVKAIQDIRNPKGGKVTTEFNVSADATASGGTLTFLQALGTNPAVEEFLQRIGILKNADGNVETSLDDLYGIMKESISDFIDGNLIDNLDAQDIDEELTGTRLLLKDTVDLLFLNEGKDLRELSKDPTMTFVYGQGRAGAVQSMSRSLADRIIDNMDSKNTRDYLNKLFAGTEEATVYGNLKAGELKDTAGLYSAIVSKLQEKEGLTDQMFDILDASINQKYLEGYKTRSNKVWKFVSKLKDLPNVKILPAAAVMAGIKPTKANLKKYGMPITKIYEVSNPTEPNQPDTVLTRRQKLAKTVFDVSTVHGIDAAQLYGSIKGVMKALGVVVVHDDVRGTVQTVRAMETEYRKVTQKIVGEYDVHQQTMLAIAAYSPEVANSPEFKKLLGDIEITVAAKKATITSDQFNSKTNALIGDGDKFVKFAGKQEEESSTESAAPETENKSENTAEAVFAELAPESEIITKFLAGANASDVDIAKANEFVPVDDKITISKTDIGRGAGKKLDLSNTADRKLQKELIEHEIVHANTVAHIIKALDNKNTPEGREVKYFLKSIEQLKTLQPALMKGLSEETVNRILYIVGRNNEVQQVSEFVAIMSTEPETAADIYSILSKNNPSLKTRIEAFINKIKAAFTGISDADLANDIDIEKLYGALVNTIAVGETNREQNYKETRKILNGYEGRFGVGSNKAKNTQRYLNYAVATMINSKLERNGKRLLGNLHLKLLEVSPMYVDAANKAAGIYDESDALQQLVHTITGNGTDKTKKANLLSDFAKVMGQQKEVINNQIGKINKALSGVPDAQKKTIGRFVSDMPLHDYFMLADHLTTAEEIDAEIISLTKDVHGEVVKEINHLIDWNVKGKGGGKLYNLEASERVQYEGGKGEDARRLLVLKSIQTIGSKDFEKFLENTDLVNVIKDTSIANSVSLLENTGTHLLTDSLVPEYYKEPFNLKAVSAEDFKSYKNGENTGWKVLQVPEGNKLGIVYKPTVDSTSIPGAYTDIKLAKTDIVVTGKNIKSDNVVKTLTGHKLRLTKEQKLELGLVEDFSQGLVRGAAHSMAINESQIIRDKLLQEDTRMVMGEDDTKLLEVIKSDNVDNPWFIKLEEGQKYENLDKKIKAKYSEVTRASDVNNFNEKVDLVRKDISHWLLGGSASSLFQNPKLKWSLRIVKDLIAGAKIGMVVLNPVKIAQDNVSNVSYLGVMGVSPIDIAKDYRNISKDFQEYSDLQRQIIQLKVQLVARPNSGKLIKKRDHLQELLRKNSLGDLSQKGFINSLGSDLVAKNADTLSGLQADMHSALEYMLLGGKNRKVHVSAFIVRLQNLGFNGEDFLTYLGKLAGKTKTAKGVQHELDSVVERLKEIRTEEDVVNYVSQYTTSPGSEAVRLGSSMTDLTDVMAKETLYRHLTKREGMDPEKARIKVLDSFPDYKENMPLAVKHLSDVGIIMFPSFWLRIQKVIYRMARDKPLNLATELMLEEALGSNVNTILDANIINKSNTFGGLLHTPLEPIGVGSVIPEHIF